MDNTSLMTSLLSELHRERNGAAADAMRFYGKPYGLNLGVALHTIRQTIADKPKNHNFAEYLYRQDVRELRIAALWLAEPERVEPESFDFWESGIINSEVAEQAAMALLCKIECADQLIAKWSLSESVLTAYALLLTISRSERCDAEIAASAIGHIADRYADNRLIARSAVTAIVALHGRNKAIAARLVEETEQKDTETARYICDELSWRLDY